MRKGIEIYTEKIENGEILKGVVTIAQFSDEHDCDILTLDLDGIRGVIKREDVDYQVEWKSLVGFVGKEIYFTVIGVDEETQTVYCSRKNAQEKMYPDVLERLKTQEVVEGEISGHLNYGAYIDIDGIYALMKNADFSLDHVAVKDVLSQGSTIKVKLLRVSENGRIAVEAAEKHQIDTIRRFDTFEKDQVILGVVNGVKPWGAYVTIAPGIDALCPIPPVGEIEEGVRVSFRITQVREDEKKVRGKILRILK